MARAATAATTKVRIAPFRCVVIDGQRREAGDVVSVPTKDAQTLIADGFAVTPGITSAPKPRAKAEKVFDAHGEVEHASKGRRKLTPRAIEDGTEERGR